MNLRPASLFTGQAARPLGSLLTDQVRRPAANLVIE